MTSRALLCVFFIVCFASGCRRATAPVASPDGSMVAIPDTTGELAITIKSKDGSVLYQWNTGASTYQWWEIKWEDNQSLFMESSDIGAYILERQPDNTWRETTPGGLFSPDGKVKVQTSWDSQKTKRLRIWFGDVLQHRSFLIRGEFQTNFVVLEPFNCARWDGNDRVIVKTLDGEHSWIRRMDGNWIREK